MPRPRGTGRRGRRPTRRTAELAAIHLGQKELGWDDATYRDVLEQLTGHRSARDLSDQERTRVLEFMRARGFAHADGQPHRAPPAPAGEAAPAAAAGPQLQLIRRYWTTLAEAGVLQDPSDRALRAFVRRVTGVASPEWLRPPEASKVIEALKAWLARSERTAAAAAHREARAAARRAIE